MATIIVGGFTRSGLDDGDILTVAEREHPLVGRAHLGPWLQSPFFELCRRANACR